MLLLLLRYGVVEPEQQKAGGVHRPFAFYNQEVRRRFGELLESVGVQPRVPYRVMGRGAGAGGGGALKS